jgi:hypothetical protein
MAIYSLPLAAVLVAAALHTDHTARAMNESPSNRDIAGVQLPAQDRIGRQTLLVLEKQLSRLRRRVRRLRMKFSLERGVVLAQLHDADAQLAHAQLKYNVEQAELVRETVSLHFQVQQSLPNAIADAMTDEPQTAVVALQRLEDEITCKMKLLLRALRHASPRRDIAVDLGVSLTTVRLEIDALTTRHHEQLGVLYDALVNKRLRLRALFALIKKLRAHKRDTCVDPRRQSHDAMATTLSLQNHEDEEDDDVPMAMLEENTDDLNGSDGDAECYDGDADDDEDEDEAVEELHVAFEEASI